MNARSHRDADAGRCDGFTLLELCVAIALISVVAGVLLNALAFYQELAERTAIDLTLLNMRSGIRQQIADKMIHGREADLEQVVAGNPVDWLAKPPPGYAGELSAGNGAAPRPGEWFFDVERRELGYVPRLRSHLRLRAAEDSMRWRIRGVRSRSGQIEDVSLVSVTRYTWF
jgi:general secretion pathway protein G